MRRSADDTQYALLAGHALGLGRRPVLFGISGAVGIGKSTAAAIIAAELERRGAAAEVVATDGFLLPTAELDQRGLGLRKGFPESYDAELLDDVLQRLRRGEPGVSVPIYSHDIYDRLPGPGRVVRAADVVIVEGVNALQAPAVDHLDVALYLEADDADLRRWFAVRFLDLCAEAAADEASFYRRFVGMDERQLRDLA
ncbi:MAG: type I pantothenate kinase, partial [Actinomycetota bacterium]